LAPLSLCEADQAAQVLPQLLKHFLLQERGLPLLALPALSISLLRVVVGLQLAAALAQAVSARVLDFL
jgi:hypothetical protein